ncbi:hypothetical protein AYY26_20800 [Photobacterium phosphoreum]|nr:hypothetical protein AYY26_20800 [Photobacterium phosphoreum]
MNSALTVYKDLLPVVTFILGYFLNWIIGTVQKRSSLNKIRKILNHEVNWNIEILVINISKIPKDLSEAEYLFKFAKVAAQRR